MLLILKFKLIHLTRDQLSLAKFYKSGITKFNFSGDTNFTNLANDLTAATLTSASTSLRRFENIYINDESATSLPTASASFKIFY